MEIPRQTLRISKLHPPNPAFARDFFCTFAPLTFLPFRLHFFSYRFEVLAKTPSLRPCPVGPPFPRSNFPPLPRSEPSVSIGPDMLPFRKPRPPPPPPPLPLNEPFPFPLEQRVFLSQPAGCFDSLKVGFSAYGLLPQAGPPRSIDPSPMKRPLDDTPQRFGNPPPPNTISLRFPLPLRC